MISLFIFSLLDIFYEYILWQIKIMSKKHGIRESIMMHYTAETTQQWAAIQHFSFFLKHVSVFA